MTSSTYIRFKFGLLSQTECSLCSFHKGLRCCLSCSSIEDASSILNTDWDGKLLQQITTGNNAVFESLFLHVSARSWCLAFFISWNYSVFVNCTYNPLLGNADYIPSSHLLRSLLIFVLASQQCWLMWPNKSDNEVMLEYTGFSISREFLIVNPSQSLFNLLS